MWQRARFPVLHIFLRVMFILSEYLSEYMGINDELTKGQVNSLFIGSSLKFLYFVADH